MENTASLRSWSPPKDTRFRRRMIYLRYLALQAFVVRRGYSLCTLGNEQTGCGWTFCPAGLGPQSIVYSGGVGNDVSFEHALVERFGCIVHLFDPSPTGIATMSRLENTNSRFRFFPVGLAGTCCTLRLSPPLCPEEGSWFSTTGAGSFDAHCMDLSTLLKRNQQTHIDILKLDIEGAEYSVLDNLLAAHVPVRQILVEFHDGLLPGIRRSQSLRAGFRLITRGFKLISIVGTTYTFIRGA